MSQLHSLLQDQELQLQEEENVIHTKHECNQMSRWSANPKILVMKRWRICMYYVLYGTNRRFPFAGCGFRSLFVSFVPSG